LVTCQKMNTHVTTRLWNLGRWDGRVACMSKTIGVYTTLATKIACEDIHEIKRRY